MVQVTPLRKTLAYSP